MKTKFLFILLLLISVCSYSQKQIFKPEVAVQLKFISSDVVIQDLQQNGQNSRYFNMAKNLFYLDSAYVDIINGIIPGTISPEYVDFSHFINERVRNGYREAWDHHALLFFDVNLQNVLDLFKDQLLYHQVKLQLNREFDQIENNIYYKGSDKALFSFHRSAGIEGSTYRAMLSGNTLRIDEISAYLE